MRSKIVVAVLAAIIVVGAGTVAGLFMTGRLAWSNPNTNVVDAYTAVCDTEIVDTYNDVMIYKEREGTEGISLDEAGVKSLEQQVRGLADNQNDPTCQSMLFWIAVYNEDYEKAKTAYENVKRLHEKRLFADSNLTGNQALSTYEGAVYTLSPEGQSSEGIRD